jgi:hypothetical protein
MVFASQFKTPDILKKMKKSLSVHWIGVWMDPRVSLDGSQSQSGCSDEENNPFLSQESNLVI